MMKRRTGWLWNVLQQHPGMEQRIKRLKDRADVGAHA
jgi:Zn-dependent protease with chaperone function